MPRLVVRLTLALTVWFAVALAPCAGYAARTSPPNRANTPTVASMMPARSLAHATGMHGARATASNRSKVTTAYGRLPLSFEQNQGQVDRGVSYLAHGQGYTAYVTGSGLVLALAPSTGATSRAAGRSHPLQSQRFAAAARAGVPATAPVLRLQLLGTRGQTTPVAQDRLLGVANYYLGNDRAKWLTNIPTFAQVTYPNVYPGVDLVYRGTQGRITFDFLLHPGAHVDQVQLRLSGVGRATPDAQGNLRLRSGSATLLAEAPHAYQMVNGHRQLVGSHYRLLSGGRIGLRLDHYDASRPLTVDPTLVYSSYLGGSGTDVANAITLDSAGDAYLTGSTTSTNFPLASPAQSSNGGQTDIFVSKLNPAGSSLLFSTYVGGSGTDVGNAIALNTANGSVVVTGSTTSTNFPTGSALLKGSKLLPLGYQIPAGLNVALVVLSSGTGALLTGAAFGGTGSESGTGIGVDLEGDIYITGSTNSTNYPSGYTNGSSNPITYPAPVQQYNGGGYDAFLTEFAYSSPSYWMTESTYLGGSGDDYATGIEVTNNGSHSVYEGGIYLTGYTSSTNFPVVSAMQTTNAGGTDAFVARLPYTDQKLQAYSYVTYLGGTGTDEALALAVDSAGAVYLTGSTTSTNFPTLTPLQASNAGGTDAFVAKLNPSGNALVYSTYLGGSGSDVGQAIAVDNQGVSYVVGTTSSTDFPTASPLQASNQGGASGDDAFVSMLSNRGIDLLYSSYLGGSGDEQGLGIAIDAGDDIYVTGQTASTNFPTAGTPVQGTSGGGIDAFVSKLTPTNCMGSGTASSGIVPWHPHVTAQLAAGVTAGVDLADGHLDLGTAAMAIPGRGPGMAMGQTYDSALAEGCVVGATGLGWASPLNERVTGAQSSFIDGAGAQYPIRQDTTQTGNPWVVSGLPLVITPTTTLPPPGVEYTLTDPASGEARTFDPQGRLLADADAYGNATSYGGYGQAGPTSISNSGGRALSLSYTNNLLSDVQSPLWVSSGGSQGQHVTYSYNQLTLTGITRGAGTTDQQTTQFGYTGPLLTSVTTAGGHTWQFGYNGSDQLVSITSPISGTAGQAGYTPAYTTTIQYGSGTATVTAGSGTSSALSSTYTLDGSGEATAIVDGLGHTTKLTYDTTHHVVNTVTDANNHTTTYGYQVVGGAGVPDLLRKPPIPMNYPSNPNLLPPTVQLTYDRVYNPITQTQEGGAQTDLYYDAHHSVVSTAVLTNTVTNTQTHTTTYYWRGTLSAYDQYGELTSTTDGRGVTVPTTTDLGLAPPVTANGQAATYTSHYAYDPQGDLTSSITAPITTTLNGITTTAPVTTTYGYDGDGNLVSVTDANGNTTTAQYDHLGRPTSETLPQVTLFDGSAASPTLSVRYDGDGHIVSRTDGAGDVSSASFDPLGRPTSGSDPIGDTSVLTYTATMRSAAQDPRGNVTTYSYDAAGRVTQVLDAAGAQRTYTYDPANNVIGVTSGNASTTVQTVQYTYYADDSLAIEAIGGPNTVTRTVNLSTDPNSYLTRVADGNGVTNFSTNNQDGPPSASTQVGGSPNTTPTGALQQTFGYDLAGNLQTINDFDGRQTTITYDGAGRVTGSVNSYSGSSITENATYDPNGNLVGWQSKSGSQTDTANAVYNAANWLASSNDDGLVTNDGYDAAGRLRTQSFPSGTLSLTPNAAGQYTQLAEGSNQTGISYNAAGQPTQVQLPNGVQQTLQYDAANRISQVTASGGSLNTTYSYGYNAIGWMNSLTTGGTTTTYTHDAQGRLTAVTSGSSTTTYTYGNNDENLTQVTPSGGLATTYTYPAPGNFSATPPNELQSTSSGSSSVGFLYDKSGHVTMTTGANNPDAGLKLTYDAAGRLTSVTLANGTVISTTYNAQGHRATYTVTPNGATQPSLSEHFQYRGGQLGQVAYTGTSITTPYTDTYLYRPNGAPLELLRTQGSSTNRYWYVLDGHGGVVALTDSSGNAVDSYQYDAWGVPTSVSESVPQQLRYAGYWYDNELGWYWLSVRSYDPALKRFLQPDPSQKEGIYSYAYAGNDPVDNVDPSGFSSATIGTANEAALCAAYGGTLDAIGGGGTTICTNTNAAEVAAELALASGQDTIDQALAAAPCHGASGGCSKYASSMTPVAENGTNGQGYACALGTPGCSGGAPSDATVQAVPAGHVQPPELGKSCFNEPEITALHNLTTVEYGVVLKTNGKCRNLTGAQNNPIRATLETRAVGNCQGENTPLATDFQTLEVLTAGPIVIIGGGSDPLVGSCIHYEDGVPTYLPYTVTGTATLRVYTNYGLLLYDLDLPKVTLQTMPPWNVIIGGIW